jgi:uncharacterized membrane protein
MQRKPHLYTILVLAGAALGLLFAGVSTYDFAQHLDRQVHSVNCSFVPGLAAADAVSDCHVTMLSHYSSVLREAVWGGLPISLPAMSVFAFLLLFTVELCLTRRQEDPRATAFLALATLLPAAVSIVMAIIAFSRLDAACKLCIGIYFASALCLLGGLCMWRRAEQLRRSGELDHLARAPRATREPREPRSRRDPRELDDSESGEPAWASAASARKPAPAAPVAPAVGGRTAPLFGARPPAVEERAASQPEWSRGGADDSSARRRDGVDDSSPRRRGGVDDSSPRRPARLASAWQSAPVSWGYLAAAFGLGVLLVAIPAGAYIALAPDHSVFIGACGELAEEKDAYGVMVPFDPHPGGVQSIEVLDPLCPACRAFESRIEASGLASELDRSAILFPLDSDCNWMVDDRKHPGACAVSEAVLCAGERAGDVVAWAFAEQEAITSAAASSGEGARKLAAQRFPELARCLGSATVKSKLNKSLRWAVRNQLPVLTPQVYVAGVKLCDEDIDLGMEFALSRMIERARAGTLGKRGGR